MKNSQQLIQQTLTVPGAYPRHWEGTDPDWIPGIYTVCHLPVSPPCPTLVTHTSMGLDTEDKAEAPLLPITGLEKLLKIL